LSYLKSLVVKLGQALVLYGAWGLFSISFLDSSFLSFPVFNDLAVILLATRRPGHAVVYALVGTAGSVLGCYVIFALSRRGGRYLWRKATPRAVERAERWLKRNDFVALLVASLLPPPMPLKVFVLTAGVLQVNPLHFGLALLVGRGLRFGADAWLGVRYGAQAETYLKQNLGRASVVAVALVIGITLLLRFAEGKWRSRSANPKTSEHPHDPHSSRGE